MADQRTWARALHGIPDVAASNLCSGCGVCAAAQPELIQMIDTVSGERRPVVNSAAGAAADTSLALSLCPGAHLAHIPNRHEQDDAEVGRIWGPVLEVWEGYAADQQIRWAGSSGGVVTALALHQMASGAAAGVLHTVSKPEDPLRNTTVLSTDRAGVLAGAGSRYSPASPGEALGLVAGTAGPSVVIGKPCDVAGTRMLARRWAELGEKISLTIGIFCAGTPRQDATIEAVESLGVDPAHVADLRYRGNGWPGEFVVSDDSGRTKSLSYQESWGSILQRQRQWRCRICPDHTAEFADVAVGDPWYRPIEPNDPGRSLVLVRTERGRRAVAAALAAGALALERVDGAVIERSQPNLVATRGAVWGRLATMRLLGMPIPHYRGMPMFATWLRRLTWRQKTQSTYGTYRRVRERGLRQPAASRQARGPG